MSSIKSKKEKDPIEECYDCKDIHTIYNNELLLCSDCIYTKFKGEKEIKTREHALDQMKIIDPVKRAFIEGMYQALIKGEMIDPSNFDDSFYLFFLDLVDRMKDLISLVQITNLPENSKEQTIASINQFIGKNKEESDNEEEEKSEKEESEESDEMEDDEEEESDESKEEDKRVSDCCGVETDLDRNGNFVCTNCTEICQDIQEEKIKKRSHKDNNQTANKKMKK